MDNLKSFLKMNFNSFYVYFLVFPSECNFEQYLYFLQNFIENTSGSVFFLLSVACNDRFYKMTRREITKKKYVI